MQSHPAFNGNPREALEFYIPGRPTINGAAH